MQVQRVIDDWASAGERLQLAFSWTDPLATSVLLVVMLLLALGLWVLGLQVLVTVGLLWVFRWVPHKRRNVSTPLCLCTGTEGLRQDTLRFLGNHPAVRVAPDQIMHSVHAAL